MPYSTGRGGAGNIQTLTTVTSENNHITPTKSTQNTAIPVSSNDDKRIYYSTGRGGAGNIASSNKMPSPKLVPQGSNTPQLRSSKVTTGRGGYGNMVDNNDPDLTRKLQDVDGPSSKSKGNEISVVMSNKSFSVGRGGMGNMIATGNSNNSNHLHEPKLYSVTSNDKYKRKKKGIFNKVKNLFGS